MSNKIIKTMSVWLLLFTLTLTSVSAVEDYQSWESKIYQIEEADSLFADETSTITVVVEFDYEKEYSYSFCPEVDELYHKKAAEKGWVLDDKTNSYYPHFCYLAAQALGVELEALDPSSREANALIMGYAEQSMMLRREAIKELNAPQLEACLSEYPEIGNGIGKITGQSIYGSFITMEVNRADLEALAKLECVKRITLYDLYEVEDELVVPVFVLSDTAGDDYHYDIDDHLVCNVVGKTALEVSSIFTKPAIPFDRYGQPLKEDAIVRTGDRLMNEEGVACYVIVKGDINYDGMLSTTDYAVLRSYIQGTAQLDYPSYLAAQLDGDASVSTTDLLVMKKMLSEI